MLQRLPLKKDKAHKICYTYEEEQPASVWVYATDKYHTPFTTHSTRSRAYSALSWILPIQPCLPIKNNKVICHQIHFVQKLKTVFEERKNTTHSGDLGTLVRNQGPTILLPPPATGALTTETQNEHLYYSRTDGARRVQCEGRLPVLATEQGHSTMLATWIQAGGRWYNGGKFKKGWGEEKKTREMHQTFIYSGHIFVKIIENDIIAHFSRKIAFMNFKSCENQGVEKSYWCFINKTTDKK